jgi:hypothetical protein
MTRVEVFRGFSPDDLSRQINAFIEGVGVEGLGVKEMHDATHPMTGDYTAMVVYGNGPIRRAT